MYYLCFSLSQLGQYRHTLGTLHFVQCLWKVDEDGRKSADRYQMIPDDVKFLHLTTNYIISQFVVVVLVPSIL